MRFTHGLPEPIKRCKGAADRRLRRAAANVAQSISCDEREYCEWKANPDRGWECDNKLTRNKGLECASAEHIHHLVNGVKEGLKDTEADFEVWNGTEDNSEAEEGVIDDASSGDLVLDGKRRKNDEKKNNKKKKMRFVAVVCRPVESCRPELNSRLSTNVEDLRKQSKMDSKLKDIISGLHHGGTNKIALNEGEEVYWVSLQRGEVTGEKCANFENDLKNADGPGIWVV